MIVCFHLLPIPLLLGDELSHEYFMHKLCLVCFLVYIISYGLSTVSTQKQWLNTLNFLIIGSMLSLWGVLASKYTKFAALRYTSRPPSTYLHAIQKTWTLSEIMTISGLFLGWLSHIWTSTARNWPLSDLIIAIAITIIIVASLAYLVRLRTEEQDLNLDLDTNDCQCAVEYTETRVSGTLFSAMLGIAFWSVAAELYRAARFLFFLPVSYLCACTFRSLLLKFLACKADLRIVEPYKPRRSSVTVLGIAALLTFFLSYVDYRVRSGWYISDTLVVGLSVVTIILSLALVAQVYLVPGPSKSLRGYGSTS